MPDDRWDLLREASSRGIAYLQQIGERRVAPEENSIEDLIHMGGPLPEEGQDARTVIELLDRYGSPATVATMGGRFFGFVVGGALPATIAAHWLADAWDQNACLYDLSPVSARCEEIVLAWVLDLLDLPRDCGGALVTGAQMANFTALAAARHATLARAGWNVEEDGLFDAPPVTVVVGEEAHVTLLKALAMLGLGSKRVLTVPADSQGRMRPDALPRISGPAIVCAQAGNVNTGASDPLDEICAAARESGAWVHVDGAFGLWALAAPNRRHLVEGARAADSWAVDAHKWLNVPQDCGLAIVRDPASLRGAMAITARYLNPGQRREPMQYGPESSRRARAVEIWAALRNLGRRGVAELVERTCRHARRFAEGLRSAGFEVLNDVVLNQVLADFGDPVTTQCVIEGVQAGGTCWCGGTVWKGRTAMRISVSSWATTDEDVEKSLHAILRVASQNIASQNKETQRF
jgi:glutamate/tyrosine decarboxylase-like PLP-dependent enzyme